MPETAGALNRFFLFFPPIVHLDQTSTLSSRQP